MLKKFKYSTKITFQSFSKSINVKSIILFMRFINYIILYYLGGLIKKDGLLGIFIYFVKYSSKADFSKYINIKFVVIFTVFVFH